MEQAPEHELPREKHRVFVAFAGGGARGLAHVGALAALEDPEHEVEFLGVSGTSAGAIIAALKASGFTSRQIVNPETGATIMERLTAIKPSMKTPTDFFSRDGWRRVSTVRALYNQRKLLLPLTVLLLAPLSAVFVPHPLDRWILAGWALLVLVLAWAIWTVVGGLAKLDEFVQALGVLLQEQMFPGQPGRVVCMRDYGRDGHPMLRVVAANLSKRRLQLFSPHRTPDVPVAEAVGASICIPLIFAVRRVRVAKEGDPDTFVDGGIVSNLPAWAWDSERELDPDALTIAIDIVKGDPKPVNGSRSWLPAAIGTALFGSAELNVRAAGRVLPITVPSPLDVLQFDLTKAEALNTVEQARLAVATIARRRLFEVPQTFRDTNATVQAITIQALTESKGVLTGPTGRVRVAVAWPDRDRGDSLRLRYGIGYEVDADRDMVLPIAGSYTGLAWVKGVPQLITGASAQEDVGSVQETRFTRLRWKERRWALCVPISEIGDSSGSAMVVVVEGDSQLNEDPETYVLLSELVGTIQDLYSNPVLHTAQQEERDADH